MIEGIEDRFEYDALRDAFVADLEASGPVETFFAERIAELCWRLRRVTRYESQSLSQSGSRKLPTLSDLNELIESRTRREKAIASLGVLFLPEDTEVDTDTVSRIVDVFHQYLGPPSGASVGELWRAHETDDTGGYSVGFLLKQLRAHGGRLGLRNLLADVYAYCSGNARNWSRNDELVAESKARNITESLLLRIEQAQIIDRYEPRLRRDLSRTLKDLHELQDRRHAKLGTHPT